ncbi:MAG TPA: GNAT family N-acetyltransferase [Gemmatimonadales bacterium]|jgi:ribosomal protein S18 acetylase RimI-like enzyme|nr:GNAT family N-acetyltransferase [Gemmatimonadales bacterium]
MPTAASSIRVVPYSPAHRRAFRDLNLEWISTYFEVEEEDRRVLNDPEGEVLAPGGAILFALDGEIPVGTGALIPTGPHEFELAKMAVTERARGRGIGRALCVALVALARERGAHQVELLSQTALGAAINLYRSLGFVEVPLGGTPYRRSNIRMVLRL